jgi:hypothetical protein
MRLTSFALVTGLALSISITSHAQEAPPVKHRSKVAYGVGIGLTSVGSLAIAAGLVCGIGGLAIAAQPNQGSDGPGPLFGMMGTIIWVASAIVGVPMLVTGIVLVAKNAPTREPVFHDSKNDLPAPSFTSLPILSGSF